MIKKGRNHIVWILAIAASWLIFYYFYYRIIETRNVVNAIVMAAVINYIGYNLSKYRKDYQKEKTN